MSKEECEIALENAVDTGIIKKDWNVLNQLIDEHFKPKENTSEFKHFKLHSDSTLKNLTKVELIDYIKMLYNNWGVTDEQLKRVIDKAKELSNSNNELERTVCSLDYALSDVYNHKPYKFEELKPNMWVYDDKFKICYKIIRFKNSKWFTARYDGFEINCDNGKRINQQGLMHFEENRFFPVQCANLIKMEVKK